MPYPVWQVALYSEYIYAFTSLQYFFFFFFLVRKGRSPNNKKLQRDHPRFAVFLEYLTYMADNIFLFTSGKKTFLKSLSYHVSIVRFSCFLFASITDMILLIPEPLFNKLIYKLLSHNIYTGKKKLRLKDFTLHHKNISRNFTMPCMKRLKVRLQLTFNSFTKLNKMAFKFLLHHLTSHATQ